MLEEVGLGGSEVSAFGGGDDADVDGSFAGLGDEGVEYFVILDEEVNVEPEGVGEYNFSELGGSGGSEGVFA